MLLAFNANRGSRYSTLFNAASFAAPQIHGVGGCWDKPRTVPTFLALAVSRGGQRYFLWGCAFARMLPTFLRPLALDRNDFKFASALSAIPL
jgi:hypothetical protein